MMPTLIISLIAALSACAAEKASQDLSRYVGVDLRKLSTNEVSTMQKELGAKTGTNLGEKWGSRSLAPWILAPFEAPEGGWVLVEAYPGYDIPDVSGIMVHFFTKSWAQKGSYAFPTGYRLYLKDVTVQTRSESNRPLIVAKVVGATRMLADESPGKSAPVPDYLDYYYLQYYTLVGTNLLMVRLQDHEGALRRNGYNTTTPFTGPAVPKRTKEEWLNSLASPNTGEKLAALVWLTGVHSPSTQERKADEGAEPLRDSRVFEDVRDDPRTAAVLKTLRDDRNQWVRDYAMLGIAGGKGERGQQKD